MHSCTSFSCSPPVWPMTTKLAWDQGNSRWMGNASLTMILSYKDLHFPWLNPVLFFFASGDGQPRWKGFANSNESKSYEHLWMRWMAKMMISNARCLTIGYAGRTGLAKLPRGTAAIRAGSLECLKMLAPNPMFAHSQRTHPNKIMLYLSSEDEWKHWLYAAILTVGLGF